MSAVLREIDEALALIDDGATGISDSPLLPGVKLIGKTAITHSILMRARSRTVRYIRAVHNLETKTIHLRHDSSDHHINPIGGNE